MKIINIKPNVMKFVRSRLATGDEKKDIMESLNRASFNRNDSGIPKSVSRNPKELIFNTVFERFMPSDKPRVSLIGPWSLKDGVVHWMNSKGDDMPYQMASTMKVVDSVGKTIALVNHSSRSIGKILAGAPTMYRLLLFMYIYREKLFADSPEANEMKDMLEKVVGVFGLGYSFSLKQADAKTILSAVSEEWLSAFTGEILNGRDDEAVNGFFDGDEKGLESMIWRTLRDAIRKVHSSFRLEDDIGDLSMQITKEIMGYDTITKEDLENVITNVMGAKHYADANEATKATSEWYTSFYGMDIDAEDGLLYVPHVDSEFDEYAHTEVGPVTVNVKNLLKTLNVRRDLVNTLPPQIEERIEKAILGGKFNRMNHADMIRVMADVYSKRNYFHKVYNYDIAEVMHDLSSNSGLRSGIDDEDLY